MYKKRHQYPQLHSHESSGCNVRSSKITLKTSSDYFHFMSSEPLPPLPQPFELAYAKLLKFLPESAQQTTRQVNPIFGACCFNEAVLLKNMKTT